MRMLFALGYRIIDWELQHVSLLPRRVGFDFGCPCVQTALIHESCAVTTFGLRRADFATRNI